MKIRNLIRMAGLAMAISAPIHGAQSDDPRGSDSFDSSPTAKPEPSVLADGQFLNAESIARWLETNRAPRETIQPALENEFVTFSGISASYAANDSASGVRTYFSSEGLHLRGPDAADQPAWEWSMQFSEAGYSGDLQDVPPGIISPPDGNRIVIDRGWITESYRYTRDGIKQDFLLHNPPPSESKHDGGEIQLHMIIDGGLHGTLAADGRSVTFREPATSREILRVSGLVVIDADGVTLKSEFDAQDGLLVLRFSDESASYPILVDPLVSVIGSRKYSIDSGDSEILASKDFGSVVAVDGDTIAVSSPTTIVPDSGFLYLISRSSGWMHHTALLANKASIALQNNRLVIGCDSDPNTSCAIKVYEKTSGWLQTATIQRPGSRFALDGNTIVIGAPGVGSNQSGKVYIFEKSGTDWVETQQLTAPAATSLGRFGKRIAIHGEHLLVSEPGAAKLHFYRRNLAGTFQFLSTYTWPSWQANVAELAVHENWAWLGLPEHSAAVGFLFDGTNWNQHTELSPSFGTDFGSSVAVVGDRLAVGAPDLGRVYAYRLVGNAWNQVNVLTAIDEPQTSGFGHSVSMDAGGTLVVGRPNDARWVVPLGSFTDVAVGSAYVFEPSEIGWAWDAKLPWPGIGKAQDRLGSSMHAFGDYLVVGAPYYDGAAGSDTGAVAIFRRGVLGTWSCIQFFPGTSPGERLGTSVIMLDGKYVAAGAPGFNGGAGRVSIYRNNNGWSKVADVVAPAPNNTQAGAGFGSSLGVFSHLLFGLPTSYSYHLVVGAPGLDLSFTDQGAAFLYQSGDSSPNTWSYVRSFTASDAAANDRFGTAIGAHGYSLGGAVQLAQIAIGAPYDDGAWTNQGAVYRFYRDTSISSAWQTLQKFIANDAAPNDQFGAAVSYDGSTLMVGAPGKDGAGSSDQGRAYFFNFFTGSPQSSNGTAPVPDALLGSSVAVLGDVAVAGAPGDSLGSGFFQGSVVLFSRINGIWGPRSKEYHAGAANADQFGSSVAVGPDFAAGGAPFDDGNAASSNNEGSFTILNLLICPTATGGVTRTSPSTICSGDTVTVNVSNSEPGVSYQLRQGSIPIGSAVLSNGGTITLSGAVTSQLNVNMTLNVLATLNSSGCSTQLNQTVTVFVLGNSAPSSVSVNRNNLCPVDSGTITLSAIGGSAGSNGNYYWYIDSCGTTPIGVGSPLVIPSPAVTTTYYVRTEGSCGVSPCNSVTVYVDQPPPPRLYVKPGGNPLCGGSWTDAIGDLSTALAIAADSNGGVQEIWVAKGTYLPTTDTNRAATFALIDGVKIYGGFSGNETSPSQRTFAANPTILSGDLLGNDGTNFLNYADNSYNVVEAPANVGPDTVLDGFIIRGGNANGSAPNNRGGGMDLNGSPVIRNCTIEFNSANAGGGGIRAAGNVSLIDCVISNNRVASSGFNAGGIRAESGDLLLLNCRILKNTSTSSGGGLSAQGSSVTAINCYFAANSAGGSGGGMALFSGNNTITNCTVLGNSTISTVGGGGIRAAGGDIKITNTIVWGNTASNAPNLSDSAGSLVTYSIVEGGFTGEGNLDVDPMLWDPDGNDNQLGTLDDNVMPFICSPALDAADSGALPASVITDLHGNPRFHDVPDIFDTGIGPVTYLDIGCVEADWSICSIPGDTNGDGLVNIVDLINVLSDFGCAGNCIGDANGDGIVNLIDLLLVLGNFGS